MLLKSISAATLLATACFAQTCVPDQLMDDFSAPLVATSGPAVGRNVNLFGGDYGTNGPATGLSFVKSDATHTGYASVKPTVIQTSNTSNFFFTKRNAEACFDLTGFLGFQFTMQVIDPTASSSVTYDSSFTLTQKSQDCLTIVNGGESQYQPISKFVPGGKIYANTMYNITLPFSAFTQHNNPAIGGLMYDFTRFKDFTWNAFLPVNVEYRFYEFGLKGNCSAIPAVNGSGSGSGSPPPHVPLVQASAVGLSGVAGIVLTVIMMSL